MGQCSGKETAHLHTDLRKFHENFDQIDWSKKLEARCVACTLKESECECNQTLVVADHNQGE